ncbi:MAG: polynucleotide adenylyltransferase PcnB [Proteobacteria bacterium]|nr:polynucleotide adenylyltransferase PcnB [Pseudomonadota bacterium]
MIRKFLRKVFSRNSPASESIATLSVIPNKRHGIRRNQINPCALKIATSLQQAGFSAYIVGGAVRDLLLGLTPKDFDVATNATPEEIHKLFRRSRIIGRRFRLVHVMCGAETVEVSTFRGPSPDHEEDSAVTPLTDAHGRLLHDNVFGSQEEDAVRRDFTVNALFYDPVKEEILDYLNGFDDIKTKKLRIIGDPVQRYREDPVRMLRAVRLASKLGMQIDAQTAQPIGDLAPLLQNVPPSRLFDEMLKLLLSGHSLSCVVELRARGLHHGLLPMLDVILEQPLGERFITIALKNTDERIKQNKPVSPGFLFAILLWHEVLSNWSALQASGEKPMPALFKAMDQVLSLQHGKLAIPRRFDAVIQEIWAMQPRFEARSGQKPFRLLSHPRFRAAYDFMQLRCESGELSAELGEWWKAFLSADSEEREKMLPKQTAGKKPRRRRSRKKPSSGSAVQPEKSNNPESL